MKRVLRSEPAQGTCLRLTDGVVEMCLAPMIFGWRVRAGFVESDGSYCLEYWCDWCCGSDRELISGTYTIMQRILENGVDLKSLPRRSAVKPWYLDEDFKEIIVTLANEVGVGPGSQVDFDLIDVETLRKGDINGAHSYTEGSEL